MPPVAPLNYTSQKGYYGLEVVPTLEGVIGTLRNPLRIPIPSRAAKWYANSPWRALLLDAEKANNAYEHALVDYRDSGAELPEAAARVRQSDTGEDPRWDELEHHHGKPRRRTSTPSRWPICYTESTRKPSATSTIDSRTARTRCTR